ncbi:atrial natriuretic peptide receptor 1 isoform X2 [Drosophila mojavensis]|nr:atrial natriuretic peptide receptor 1 isoform X2 [Drosophila mojavensis]XP_017868205.1 PREDICTED: atrial natriuretic peptide receptor 1 [Drosophila arizonae]
MWLLMLTTCLGLVLFEIGFGLHLAGKRSDIESWEGIERAVDGISHQARSSNGNFNGHSNDSIDIKVFERIRETKNQAGSLNERDLSRMRVYNVGVLMASHLDSPFDLERCGPAVDLALDQINKRFLSPHNIRLVKKKASYPSCSGAKAPGLAADMHFKDDVIAFIGPACAFALEPVARLAAYWNTPIITGMGDQPPSSEGELTVTSGMLGRIHKWKNESTGMFKDKSKYPTLTRMSYCQCRLKLVFASVFRQFNWKHVALLVDRSELFSLTVGKNLEYGLRQEGLLSFVRELNGNEEEIYENYLRDASMYARVVILSVRGVLVRKFMLAAHSLGMTNGEWVFLDVEIFQSAYWGDKDWELGDENDMKARKAYEALLRVSLLQPTSPTFQDFADNVRENALTEYNYTFGEGEEVNFFIGAFYDGVYLLGMALNETLTEGGDIRDGVNITRRMWNRTFHGITGHVRIDDNGDRDADYSILDLDPINGKFSVVAHYYGLHRKYAAAHGKKIHWPGGREEPPPDIPPCGFLGNAPDCHGNETTIMYSAFGLALFLGLVLLVICLLQKQMKLSKELHNMSWRVRPEDVLIEMGGMFGSKGGLQRLDVENISLQQFGIHSGRASIASFASLPPQVYTTIGQFKGERVAIKKVNVKKVEVTSTLLWEIKQARDVSHENTVRFVGACIDLPRPTVLILTEYCSRGSLKDVLENEAIELDWNFRMSLIHDIVKGMSYLHNCDVVAHGKLRSCNCLIDGRFVLKISDFGLSTLTTPSDFVRDQNYYTKLLWIAPELLPMTSIPGCPATQRGDVYSFGIILEEIVNRGGPYQEARQQGMDVHTILHKVRQCEYPPFRPLIRERECPPDLLVLMEKCWADNQEERPAFSTIRSNIRTIMKGFCENLMDDLLNRMEHYANNLESLVEEKTRQLSLEKQRTEELLYQILPRPVAQQLMAGDLVEPEEFSSVTIYFSDIVGFTELCARSTPMDVVNFLNDLYSTFDRIIGFYDVYKVETIGDAYLVVSGLPEPNGDKHAREIALMALDILQAVCSFNLRHKPDYKIQIRIGMHSGSVCAGVVGKKMPHYCLFGDTVNTASRLETTGMPGKIHVSSATKAILDKFGTFQLEHRGDVELKGKGTVTTYWLNSTTEADARAPTPPLLNNDEVPFPLLFAGMGK